MKTLTLIFTFLFSSTILAQASDFCFSKLEQDLTAQQEMIRKVQKTMNVSVAIVLFNKKIKTAHSNASGISPEDVTTDVQFSFREGIPKLIITSKVITIGGDELMLSNERNLSMVSQDIPDENGRLGNKTNCHFVHYYILASSTYEQSKYPDLINVSHNNDNLGRVWSPFSDHVDVLY